MGQPPCAGNFGVGACTPPAPAAVARGDLNGAGLPDVVVGSSAYKYEEAEGTNPACNVTVQGGGRGQVGISSAGIGWPWRSAVIVAVR